MATTADDRQRTLYLEDGGVLGHPGEDGGFALHWEFWAQVRMAFVNATDDRLETGVPATQAAALADLVEGLSADPDWHLHLYLWGDEDGRVVRSFVRFLRAGAFVVCDRAGPAASGGDADARPPRP